MAGYFGCGTTQNKISWTMFVGLKVVGIVFLIIWLIKRSSYSDQLQECTDQIDFYSTDWEGEVYQCDAQYKSHLNELNTYFGLWIVFWVAGWIPYCYIRCCAEGPVDEESKKAGYTII